MGKFEIFREKYPEFIYHGFTVSEEIDKLKIKYHFEIKDLSEFCPEWTFPKNSDAKIDETVRNLIFSIGMVELVSYWKITCSPKVKVNCGIITKEQVDWWKKQYFNGLGEFFYKNEITTDINSFMEIISSGEKFLPADSEKELKGSLIPIGGGKDSIVTLNLLKGDKKENSCYIINPRGATVKTAEVAGYDESEVFSAYRTLDANMLELNRQGFLNGHTPFSALVAFSAVLTAYLNGKKYVVLSNESSANESTVSGTDVNHQYSKSFQFEKDFNEYEKKYINSKVYYFSLLRPWSEYQIAKYFAKLKDFHSVFRSCNVGSKKDIWCADCSKCLFVAIILSPFLSLDEIEKIFGKNLFDEEKMIPILKQLIGIDKEKPFECVGSRDEINTSLVMAIQREKNLPLLLDFSPGTELFKEYSNRKNPYENYYNEENLLPEHFQKLLKNAF